MNTLIQRFLADMPSFWQTFQKACLVGATCIASLTAAKLIPDWAGALGVVLTAAAGFAAQFTATPEALKKSTAENKAKATLEVEKQAF